MSKSTLPTVHILYENPAWLPPLEAGLVAEGFSYRLVKVNEGVVDPSETPPEGIWINRISPSSHTRGHSTTVALAREILAWLEAHGRRVINGLNAFELEMSKLRQEIALQRHGIKTPRTILTVGRDQTLRAAQSFKGPFITKHNQGGKGLGIRLFESVDQLRVYLDNEEFDAGPEGKLILQDYITPATPHITRVEIVGDRFLFAMKSSTARGFELCPSDACQIPAAAPEVCPADGATSKFTPAHLKANDPLIQSYIKLCKAEGIEVAGIEFVEDKHGDRYTYDINGTTNYSGVLGRKIGIDGMREFARYLRQAVVPELATRQERAA